ncbi:universal stress protein [Nocardia brasiliensis]|uniref:universal stress protein n=1 Tax=Nocardia brasiliensis TaxID=37326 RepID=UPI002455E13A|nr:universal stress protein [Nocardia brasiliensis]
MSPVPNENLHHLASAPVVVGVDGSAGSKLAVRWAAELAAQRNRRLLIVHGLDLVATQAMLGGYDMLSPSVLDTMRTRGADTLAEARSLAHEVAPDTDITTELAESNPARTLIELSLSAYTLVLGATGNAGQFAHLGSTLLAVTSHSHGRVVVVRDAPGQDLRREGPVVVGVDGSPLSEVAIAAAFAEASERDADLVAVHCWSDWHFGEFAGHLNVGLMGPNSETGEDAILAERLAGWPEKYPDVTLISEVSASRPSEILLDWSKSAQLIVVGSRGRGGFAGLVLGSTSNFLVQHAQCPVMVTHKP